MSKVGYEKLTMLQRSFEEAHPGHRLITVVPTMLATARYGRSKGYAGYGETPCCLNLNTSLHLFRTPVYSQHHRRNVYLFHAVQHRPSPNPFMIHF